MLEEEKEKASELETALQDSQQRYAEDSKRWKASEARYKELLDQTHDYAKKSELAANSVSKEAVQEMENKLKERKDKIEELTNKLQEHEEKRLITEEELKLKYN